MLLKAGIQESRCKRLVWNSKNDIADGEYQTVICYFRRIAEISTSLTLWNNSKGQKAFVLKPYEQQDSKEKPVVNYQ